MKFLIAGLGSIGRRHFHNLVSLGEKDIILYRTQQSTLPDDTLIDFPVEHSLQEALAHQPDAVIIANPTALHLDVAIPVAEAGCHLLIEKPIAEKLDDRVETLRQTVVDKNIKVLVGFQFRFHPVLEGIREKITSHQFGRPLNFRIHWGEYLPNWHPWEDYRQSYAARQNLGGGVVNTLCHPIDYTRWLFGEMEALSAYTDKVSGLDLDVEDLAEITIKFDSGCVGSIHLDYFQRPPAHWMEITLENGIIRWDNQSGTARILRVDGQEPELIEPPAGFSRNDLFVAEMKHFLNMILDDASPRCDLDDGIRSLKVTSAVHQSNHQKSTMIEI